MDNASVYSDEDTLAPIREPAAKKAQQPALQMAARRGTMMNSRKSISLGARGAAMLGFALGGRGRASGDPTAATIRLENTYRMQPKEEERFSWSRVRPLVLEAMEEQLTAFEYPDQTKVGGSQVAGRKACDLAQGIRDRVREAGFDRYKLVVSVCLLPRAADCAAAVATRAVWAVECGDSYVECRYQNRTITAVATVHAFYFE